MRDRRTSAKVLRVGVPLGVGVLALIAGINGPLAQMSEMDGFDRAITTGSKEDALAFINDFRSSHLVPDLIELLPPDVAAAVCADLAGGGSSATDRACDQIQKAIAVAPAAGIPATPPPVPEEAVTLPPVTEEAVTPAAVSYQAAPPADEDDDENTGGDSSNGGGGESNSSGTTSDSSSGTTSDSSSGTTSDSSSGNSSSNSSSNSGG